MNPVTTFGDSFWRRETFWRLVYRDFKRPTEGLPHFPDDMWGSHLTHYATLRFGVRTIDLQPYANMTAAYRKAIENNQNFYADACAVAAYS